MSATYLRWTYSPLFFFTAPATPEIYTLSLHDALPISVATAVDAAARTADSSVPNAPGIDTRRLTRHLRDAGALPGALDRKSTRLNSSHTVISYAVFCLKKKNKHTKTKKK